MRPSAITLFGSRKFTKSIHQNGDKPWISSVDNYRRRSLQPSVSVQFAAALLVVVRDRLHAAAVGGDGPAPS